VVKVKVLNMYKPKKTEKQSDEQVGGVIVDFARNRFGEAQARAREFVAQGPFQWITENQPVRKAVLLETLEFLRPGIEVSHEHTIEEWKKTR